MPDQEGGASRWRQKVHLTQLPSIHSLCFLLPKFLIERCRKSVLRAVAAVFASVSIASLSPLTTLTFFVLLRLAH